MPWTPKDVMEVLMANGHDDLAQELSNRERIMESEYAGNITGSDEITRLYTPEHGESYGGNGTTQEIPGPSINTSMKQRATAADLDQPELIRAITHEKPSKQHKTDLYVCRIYRRSGGDCQIYEDVKHVWWTADSSVLVIVQYTNIDRTAWRNISWLREVIDWYTVTHMEFE